METKCLGLLVSVLACGCSGASLELGVLEGEGGGGASAAAGSTATAGKPAQSNAGSSSGGTSSTPSGDSAEGGAAEVGGTGPAGGSAPGSLTPEDDGADCDVPALPAASELTATLDELPDPFTKLDGSLLTHESEWRCRRAELKKQAEKYAFGTKPLAPPEVTGTVSSSTITVSLANGAETASFSAQVRLPASGSAPYPVIIDYGGSAPLARSVLDDEGVAVITFDPYDIAADSGSGRPRSGAFYDLNPSSGATGTLMAWAWGVSRIIDVLEVSGASVIDSQAIGVSGCSRWGKGSFIAGVFDQRVALTLPFESGTAGVPAWRGVAKGEAVGDSDPSQTLASAYQEQPWWGDAFVPFLGADAIKKNPLDTHELVAMVAPRGLLVFDNPSIGLLSPKYGHLAVLGGAEVYEALGVGAHVGYISDQSGEGHCALRPEWEAPLRAAIKGFLSKTSSPALEIQPKTGVAAELSEWREWTTPTLD